MFAALSPVYPQPTADIRHKDRIFTSALRQPASIEILRDRHHLYGEIDVRISVSPHMSRHLKSPRRQHRRVHLHALNRGDCNETHFVTAVVSIFAAVLAPAALAATATPFGGATVNDGILTLVSNTGDAGSTNDASGATFSDTGVTTFSSITQLSAEFNVTDDDCLSGSPRFQIRVDTPSVVEDKNVFVYPRSHPDSLRRLRREHVALHGQPDRIYYQRSVRHFADPAGRHPGLDLRAGTRACRHLSGDGHLAGRRLRLGVHRQGADRPGAECPGQHLDLLHGRDDTTTYERWSQPGAGLQEVAHRHGCDGLRLKYGTNQNGANAYGKCVSAMARMKNDGARAASVTRIDAAAAKCAKLTTPKNGKGKAKGLAKHNTLAA